jgi:hypothetical protein
MDLRQPILNLRAALSGAHENAYGRSAPDELQSLLRLSVEKLDELLGATEPTIRSRVALRAHDTLAQAHAALLAWQSWLDEGALSDACA